MARFALIFAIACIFSASGAFAGGPVINPALLQAAGTSDQPLNIFITMREGTENVLGSVAGMRATFATVSDRRTALYAALRLHAQVTQAPLMSLLKTVKSGGVTSFWITNQIYVRGADASLLSLLAEREDVARVDKEAQVAIESLIDLKLAPEPTPKAVDYNLEIIRLPEVWANGVNGTGVVVANIDTGVRGTHQALSQNYKNDEYSWFDPVTSTKTPTDDHTHGTMTMGLLAGGLDVGVAHGAKWIACKGLNSGGVGDQFDLLTCGQWILCPTLPEGTNPDCSKAPHIVSNSWNSVDTGATWFLPAIDAWREGGILAVWSAGNYGERGCASLGSHAPYPHVVAVGSTNSLDRLSYFSSQGPSPLDEKLFKPEISAPGENVRSAHNLGDNVYAQASGTSMAAPHVAGVLALVMGMDPTLQFDEAQFVLQHSASTSAVSDGAVCNGQPDTLFPNFQFGYGRLDALGAYECVRDGYVCLRTEYPPTTDLPPPTTIEIIP